MLQELRHRFARWLAYRQETGERGWVVLQRNRLLSGVEGVGRIRGLQPA